MHNRTRKNDTDTGCMTGALNREGGTITIIDDAFIEGAVTVNFEPSEIKSGTITIDRNAI